MRSSTSACTEGTAAEAKARGSSLIRPITFLRASTSSSLSWGKKVCWSSAMQLSLLPGVAVTPKATTKTVTPWARSSLATVQGSFGLPLGPLVVPQVSSPSVRISRYLLRHLKPSSCSTAAFVLPATAAQEIYHSLKYANELPIGVEPLAKSGRLLLSLRRRKVSEPLRVLLR